MGLFKVNFRNTDLSVTEAIVVLLGVLAILSGLVWLGATVLAWAWALTLVPIFGLPAITKLQAFGIMVILWFIGSAFKSDNSKE